MRKKIRGAVYDTETARELASWPSADIPEVDERLYQTKSGKYFVLAVRLGLDDRQHSIVPKSREEAIELACYALGLEKARPLFEDDVDAGERQLNVRVSARTRSILKAVAGERGVSMGQLIEELVNEGEPFGDDNVVFERVAERERRAKEIAAKVSEMRQGGDAL